MKIGIVGVSGYGGSELLRLVAGHPAFALAYVGGESTAGQALAQRFPALAGHPAGRLVIQPFEPEKISGLDLLFAYTEKAHPFTPAEVATLIAAIDALKILDPACGSGAFPMGVLHKLVYKRLNALKLLDEVRRIKDRILNPASHAGAAPLYKKEAEDAIKVIKSLDTALAAALAAL